MIQKFLRVLSQTQIRQGFTTIGGKVQWPNFDIINMTDIQLMLQMHTLYLVLFNQSLCAKVKNWIWIEPGSMGSNVKIKVRVNKHTMNVHTRFYHWKFGVCPGLSSVATKFRLLKFNIQSMGDIAAKHIRSVF